MAREGVMERIISEDEIIIRDGELVLAHFEENGNGMEGEVFEGNKPISESGKAYRMTASDLISLARWLLQKAEDRALDMETS